jgi:Tfp pilus assembly protein PilE
MRKSCITGFTLVELAVSIIIIGLILGGVASGAKLITQAEIRSVISDLQKFAGYYNMFSSQYDGVPGDFNMAESYWSGTLCHTTVPLACNGNGDGVVRWMDTAVTAAGVGDEAGRALKHLDLAGIMEGISIGKLTITYAGGLNKLTTATQIEPPHNKRDITSCLFYAYNPSVVATTSDAIGENAGGTAFYASPWAGQGINAVFYGKMIATADKSCVDGIMTPLQAFQIDEKIDDGNYIGGAAVGAQTGNIRAINTPSGSCLSGANYAVTTTTKVCVTGLALGN